MADVGRGRAVRERVIPRALLVLLCVGALCACGSDAQHLLSPRTIAERVGTHYGDPRAAVVSARSDTTEAEHEPMYAMTVSGDLSKDGVRASRISFSALATRLYVWDVRAFDGAGRLVWTEPDWAHASPAQPGS